MVRCAPSTRRRARGCSHVAALEAIQRGLSPDEKLLAFLDDLCIVSKPQRVEMLFSVAQRELWGPLQDPPSWSQTRGVQQVAESGRSS